MGNPINNTLKRAAQQLRREMKRNKGDERRAEKRFQRRRIREMVRAARHGNSVGSLDWLPEAKAVEAAKKQGRELATKLAQIEKLLPSAKPRKKKK